MTIVINGTTGISGVDGSAGTPSYVGGDSDTGLWYPAANTLALSTGGSERLRIDSSGNVGIGVTGASTVRLFVKGSTADSTAWALYADNSSSTNIFNIRNDGQAYFSGNCGIGTNSPATILHLKSSGATTTLRLEPSSSTTIYTQVRGVNGDLYLEADANNAESASSMIFTVDATERCRITSGGDLLIACTSSTNTASTGGRLYTDGAIWSTMSASTNGGGSGFLLYSTGAAATRFYVGLGGTIYATSTTISAISDQRLKENIQDIDVGLDAVMALKPRKFDWKEGKGKDKKGDRGWIAQEFEQVFPEMIDTWKDPAPEGEEPYKSVNADLIPVLVKAIQEQQAMIETLKAEVALLKSK